MSTRVTILRDLIHQHRANNIFPQEIHMCEKTRKEFVQEAAINPEPVADTRSLWQRWGRYPEAPEAVLRFEGVLLVTNSAIGEGGMLLRPLQLMKDPEWLQTIKWAEHEAKITAKTAPVDPEAPWHQRVAVEREDVITSDAGLSPEDIAMGGGINPSTVLMKAFEGLDKIEDVVVLRFYKGGSIDLCSTMRKYAVIGALQAALGHVANGED